MDPLADIDNMSASDLKTALHNEALELIITAYNVPSHRVTDENRNPGRNILRVLRHCKTTLATELSQPWNALE